MTARRKWAQRILLVMLVIFIGGCSVSGHPRAKPENSLHYRFPMPLKFPFEVDEAWTETAVDDINIMHQFILHYKNTETGQEIRYILSKSVGQPDKVVVAGKREMELQSGKKAYYRDLDYSQSLWWERDDGMIARLVYQLEGSRAPLGEYKLDPAVLADLADQVERVR